MTRRRLLLTLFLTALIPITAVLYKRLFSGSTPVSPEAFRHPMTVPDQPTIIIVGAGLAGLSAAYAALNHTSALPPSGGDVRPRIVLLERAPKPGGNSIKASSGINGAPTPYQPYPDTTFFADTVRSAGIRLSSPSSSSASARANREALIAKLTNSSADAISFLSDEIGVDLTVVAQLGGHSAARTHRGAGKTPPGAAIVGALLERLRRSERFELKTGSEVVRLLSAPGVAGANGRVTGVQFRCRADADGTDAGAPECDGNQGLQSLRGPVIFATGGFAGDTAGLLATYRPDLAGLPSTNEPRPGAHGLLTSVGAQLVDMDAVQIHPTGFIDPTTPQARLKFLAAEMLRGEGGILLYHGRRFTNEMETREVVSNAIMGLPISDDDLKTAAGDNSGDGDGTKIRQYPLTILLDPGTCAAASSHVSFYLWKGLLAKRKIASLDPTTRDSIREYSSIAAGKHPDRFGRTVFGHWSLRGAPDEDEQEVCIGRVTPVAHFTMGGAVTDTNGSVLASRLGDAEPRPIEGLWAAGEVTGGIHGDNRLGGSSLLECVVFGLSAGTQAATYLSRTS